MLFSRRRCASLPIIRIWREMLYTFTGEVVEHSTSNPRREPRIFILIILMIASLIPLWAAYRHHTFLSDDAYITLTYVKNLVKGHGFVFNYGPPILGTTTPLFTLIIAG